MTAFELGRRPALDGIRAVAVVAVLVGHAQAIRGERLGSGGVIGVYVFFVLSGFLITALLVEESRRNGAVSLPRFYARRALRLLPALFLVLAAVGLVAAFRPENGSAVRSAKAIPAALLYYGNLVSAHSGCEALGYLAHTWSLSVEEQFYLLWPLVFVLAGRRSRALLVVAVTGAVASAAWRAYLWPQPNECRVGHAPDAQADALLVGCVTALVLYAATPAARDRLARAARVLLVPATAWLVVEAAWAPGGAAFAYRFGNVLVGLASAVLVLYVVLGTGGGPLAAPAAVAVGRRSYGIYLWHVVVLGVFATNGFSANESVLAMLVLTPLLAWLSYRYVEAPVLRRKDRFAPVRAGFG